MKILVCGDRFWTGIDSIKKEFGSIIQPMQLLSMVPLKVRMVQPDM